MSEHLADLVAVLPEHDAEQRERQRDQPEVDRRAEPGALGLAGNGRAVSHEIDLAIEGKCESRGAQSTPLVEGMSDDRGSGSTAARIARARPLKIASLMWWVLRP